MAATIIATVGADNANSFGTLAEADAYHETVYHPDDPWPTATDGVTIDKKNRALIMATQLLINMVEWSGYQTTVTQRLPWPRTGMLQRSGLAYVSSTVIPEEVKFAQFELARLLIAGERTAESEVAENGITYLRAGSVTLKFKDSAQGESVIPDYIGSFLVPSWYESITGGAELEIELLRA
jgi:hypothetical protein